jgi:hypothetical protein
MTRSMLAHSLTVVVQKSLLNRARERAEQNANFLNFALARLRELRLC